MKIEITIPKDRKYVERLFDALDKIEGSEKHEHVRLRKFIIEEFRHIRAKYHGNKKIDAESLIGVDLMAPLERPVYQNTKLDKYRVKRFETSIDDSIDSIARIIRRKKSENN
jgi:hypothetical protein